MGDWQQHAIAWKDLRIGRGYQIRRTGLALVATGGGLMRTEIVVADDQARLRIGKRHRSVTSGSSSSDLCSASLPVQDREGVLKATERLRETPIG